MNDRPILLRMTNVEKRYGKRRVLSVEDFELADGDHILLSGANGSGKSTLLRVIANLTPISRGSIARSAALVNMVVGFVPQAGGLYGDMTLRQNLAVYAKMYDTQPARPAEDIWLVRDTSLRSFIDVPVGVMSGGIHQLAAFACVLAAGPHALLLDEPASELDATHSAQIYDCLSQIRDSLNFIVVSSHESRRFDFVNRHVTMKDGSIVS